MARGDPYLVVEPRRHTRESITALLWPESDAAHGRAALRTTLAYLRTALGSQATRVQADRGTLEFDVGEARLDLAALGEDVYGTFFDGVSIDDAPEFEEWLTLQRERWRRHVSRVLERTTRQYLDNRNAAAAVVSAERWLTLDPLSEPALRHVLQAYLAVGEPASALQA